MYRQSSRVHVSNVVGLKYDVKQSRRVLALIVQLCNAHVRGLQHSRHAMESLFHFVCV
jgi:hypothetical protein